MTDDNLDELAGFLSMLAHAYTSDDQGDSGYRYAKLLLESHWIRQRDWQVYREGYTVGYRDGWTDRPAEML